ncbi:MAG: IS1380 family transposase [Gammaproteobacteria bacterium]|nr:MAG: IS1380 family transposase [Gammaproteobacteria bacterium]
MKTECKVNQLEFHGLGRRNIVGKFDGGKITSDAGGVLLRETEKRTHILERLSHCFVDHRDPERIEHTLGSLIKQRVFGLALGYEDLNDHDALRQDPLLALLSDKQDLLGVDRVRKQDKGRALAGKSTLNRLELTPTDADARSRYKKIVANPEAMDALLVDLFLASYPSPPDEIILDVDATDDPLHGHQEGRFFHGYYRHYCYLPLYIFAGEHLLCARLRTANQDGAAGTIDEVSRIVARLRLQWPDVRIILRGDSGFCRDNLMDWCEHNQVDYILGLAKNNRLKKIIKDEMAQAKTAYEESEKAARVFKDFRYRTLKSWSCERRVVGKAEHLGKGENPRFVVSSLSSSQMDARRLYEDLYCARGEMENRIKEQQLGLFADRTSTHEMQSNQLRLYFSSFAYVLMQTLRRLGLKGTAMEKAQATTIRLKLFKIGAQIRVTVRKVWLSFSDSYPYADLFQQVLNNLLKIPLRC